ncbi:MAG: hypothetical protein KJ621_21240 [Proteobacteria bacterium]|nr:hypothetical protein [Pseudomonadota bacterium]
MTRYNWFRMYNEARNDKKLALLSDSQHRVWFNLLCCASDSKERGTVPYPDHALLSIEVAGGDESLLFETLKQLQRLRIVYVYDGDRIIFLRWEDRQYDKPSDTPEEVKKRVTKHRKGVTTGKETPTKRDVTRCNAEKRLYDRIGEDSIGENTPLSGDGVLELSGVEDKKTPSPYLTDFEAFWKEYPRHVNRKKAHAAYVARRRDGELAAVLHRAAQRYAASCRAKGTEDQYILHGSTFLAEDGPYTEQQAFPASVPPPRDVNIPNLSEAQKAERALYED